MSNNPPFIRYLLNNINDFTENLPEGSITIDKLDYPLTPVDDSDLATKKYVDEHASDGSVTSINIQSASNNLTASGGPITSSGTINIALNGELNGLGNLNTNGLITRTDAGTYTSVI